MEFDVNKHVKSYWNKFIVLIDKDEEFTDATAEHNVRTSKFLDPIMPEINKHYIVRE
ncbi:hypothetical protein METP3_02397 [Methanosarcinales archaeon]|nr:hypothetical protein METP3_02397 [Methanosarcinales archaeon]